MQMPHGVISSRWEQALLEVSFLVRQVTPYLELETLSPMLDKQLSQAMLRPSLMPQQVVLVPSVALLEDKQATLSQM